MVNLLVENELVTRGMRCNRIERTCCGNRNAICRNDLHRKQAIEGLGRVLIRGLEPNLNRIVTS